ncbi:uncharacterized protein KY384_009034 [Bacidia gigantensis]|uniref:uncharacterized protein n=1 Tax=Bacidia gigantensis TaxID=2732470 RepID=UPI001D058BDE|nr:uncharacterized protein KY384_009034 [Bacidia gigantensis]KAG8525390.1 hypothetical protein KY384_009034 [Bacidia gigantensis]
MKNYTTEKQEKDGMKDGHNDFAIMIRILYQNNIYSKKFASDFEDGGMRFHVDLPRLKEGRSGGAFWSAFIPCPEDGMDFSHSNYAQAVGATASQIDLIHRLTTAYADKFSDPLLDSHHALLGFNKYQKLISPIGIEGLHQIGNAFSNLRLFNSLGVKYATLTWNCHNIFADAALVTNSSGTTIAAPPYWHGLSNQKGPQIIQEMNRIGMLVDLSHVSKDTMLDVLGANPSKTKGSRAPVMFSHSSAYALCPHPRNVQDDVLQLVKKTNSIVMINFSPDFISCVPNPDSSTGLPNFDPSNSTLHQVARHVVYIASLIGYDHVGIGSDFDGMFSVPEGLEDVSKYPDLVAELLRMGVSDDDAKKIVGLNVLRVWGDAEKVAREMQAEGFLPIEDDIPEMNFTASLFTGHGVY